MFTLHARGNFKLISTLDQCANFKDSVPLRQSRSAVLVPSIPCILDFARVFLFSEWRWDCGRASSKKKRRNPKFKIHCLGHYTIFLLRWLFRVYRFTLGSASGITARATSAQILGAGKQKVERLKYQEMSRSLDCPQLLGERKFSLPGSGSPPAGGVCPRHPHSTFFIFSFVVSLSLLDFSISSAGRHSYLQPWTPQR